MCAPTLPLLLLLPLLLPCCDRTFFEREGGEPRRAHSLTKLSSSA
jgi:hypothetical protein